MLKPGVFKHLTCRNGIYPKSGINRFPVNEDCIFWNVDFPQYEPVEYTAEHVNGQVWADPDIAATNFKPKWNELDGAVNRVSFNGEYALQDGRPQNPFGRTGVRGRGLLGRWGPNHAADPIVTRWKRDTLEQAIHNDESNRPILQMVAIQRRDNHMWAIPGGMVDPGEKVSTTLKREFMEEALDSDKQKQMIEHFFANGVEMYKGYVDDFRNTDNAWMETVAYNFHDESGTEVGKLELTAGDDAAKVKWTDIDANLKLHANHITMIEQVVKRLNAHWN